MRVCRSVFSVLVLALPAGATTSYNTLAAMQAANPGLTFAPVDFGLSGSSATFFDFEGGALVFTSSLNNGLQKIVSPGGTWPAATVIEQQVGGIISITLPVGTTAFGATIGQTSAGLPGTITLSGNSDGAFSFDVFSGTATTPGYIGVCSPSPFTNLQLSVNFGSLRFGLNDFSYATAPAGDPVAEPGTLVLIGTGLLMVPLFARRSRRQWWRLDAPDAAL
jgi:hypothetical protein